MDVNIDLPSQSWRGIWQWQSYLVRTEIFWRPWAYRWVVDVLQTPKSFLDPYVQSSAPLLFSYAWIANQLSINLESLAWEPNSFNVIPFWSERIRERENLNWKECEPLQTRRTRLVCYYWIYRERCLKNQSIMLTIGSITIHVFIIWNNNPSDRIYLFFQIVYP